MFNEHFVMKTESTHPIDWFRKFSYEGYIWKGKGRPRVIEESVERIRNAFVPSSSKSTRRASQQLHMTVDRKDSIAEYISIQTKLQLRQSLIEIKETIL